MTTPIEPHLWVTNLSDSIQWYRDVLGFDVADWFPEEDGATWCQMTRGAASLMLAIVPDPANVADHQQYLRVLPERVDGPGAPLSLYLRVAEADPIHRAAVDADANIVEEVWDAWWGGRQFTVADPDGTWWTVFQPAD